MSAILNSFGQITSESKVLPIRVGKVVTGASAGEEGGIEVWQYGQKEDKRKKCSPLNTNRNTCGDCKVTACERLRQYTAQLHAVNYSCCSLCTVWRANFSLYVPCCLVSWCHDSSQASHKFSEVRRNEILNTRINIRVLSVKVIFLLPSSDRAAGSAQVICSSMN